MVPAIALILADRAVTILLISGETLPPSDCFCGAVGCARLHTSW